MQLSVIIVNYNVKYLLEECLLSILNASKSVETEILVVDNASTDDSIGYLQPKFPQIEFIQNNQNLGFAKANNLALKKAKGQYILFLNPDTLMPPDCFEKCIAFMNEHAGAGALGVRMVNGKGEFLKESKRGFPSPSVSFWKMTGLTSVFPQSPIFARYYLGHLDEDKIHEVDVLSGAFFFVRKSVLDITGGFDERFFMYAEDIDLSYRIQQAGFHNFYYPDTTIVHYKGESTKKDLVYVKQFYFAMSQFVEKHYGKGLYSTFITAAIWLRAGADVLFKKRK